MLRLELRVYLLRRGLRGWRAWWREKRVKHVAIETELRELLAGGARSEADEVYAKRGEGSAARVALTNLDGPLTK